MMFPIYIDILCQLCFQLVTGIPAWASIILMGVIGTAYTALVCYPFEFVKFYRKCHVTRFPWKPKE